MPAAAGDRLALVVSPPASPIAGNQRQARE